MGYFIFFTSDERLIIYTFLGELFLDQYIKVLSKAEIQKITTIQIYVHNRSLLLLGTNYGNIYIIDFLKIKRFSVSFPYKTYSRIKNNIIKECQRVLPNPIVQFEIVLIPGDVPSYRIYTLFENGSLEYYFDSKMMGKKLKSNALLSSLGLFKSK